nr:molecular chaperone DnaJ [uncultured Kingella sp.]
MSNQDYYATLGVSRTAGDDEIKKAYRKMAMKYHPDRNPGDAAAEEKFKEVQKAYEILSDAQKRATYDQYGHAAFEQGGFGAGGFGGFGGAQGFDFSDIFSQMFGGAAGGGRQQNHQGADLQYNIEITLEEAATGIRKQITIPTYEECGTCHGSGAKAGTKATTCRTCHGSGVVHVRQAIFQIQQTCPACGGSGKEIKDPCPQCHGEGRVKAAKTVEVNIPAGIDDGQRIRLSGEGEPGIHGAPPGDLYIHVSVKAHKIFQRDPEVPTDLHCELPISITTAALGGEVEVPTLDGKVKLSIPAGTQNGKRMRVKGKGVKSVRSSLVGDLYCHIVVETPVNLTERQKELLAEFETISTGLERSQTPRQKSFWERIKDKFEDKFD